MTHIALEGTDLLQTGSVEHGEPGPSRLEDLSRRVSRPVQALRSVPNLGTWVGISVAVVGMVLIAVAWGRTAGLTDVALQVPFVVSAGFTGLGLVAVGLTAVNISAKQQDARERTRQVGELRELLAELRRTVEEEQR